MANLRYKPSGRVSFWGVLKMLIGGILGAVILLCVYVYGLNLMPNLALRAMVLLVLLFLLSRWMGRLAKKGRFRSPAAAFWISALVLLIALYFHWIVYVVMVQDVWEYGKDAFWRSHFRPDTLWQAGRLFLDPAQLWNQVMKIRDTGFWSIRGIPVTGIRLTVCWILEMLVIILIPSFRAMTQARRIYSEDQRMWLDQQSEFTIAYIKDHRMLRRKLIKGEVDGLQDIHYYHRRGREAHGTMVFYHHKGILGPYVSIKMVKAVQTGPRHTKHYFIPIIKQWDIGTQKAEEIFARLLQEKGTTHEKVTEKGNWKDRYFWSNKREQISFAMQQKMERAKENSDVRDAKYYTGGEKIAKLEEVTVYAPTITPEMEQQYLEKKAREEQEKIWAANKEAVKNQRKKNKNKRHSTRIK